MIQINRPTHKAFFQINVRSDRFWNLCTQNETKPVSEEFKRQHTSATLRNKHLTECKPYKWNGLWSTMRCGQGERKRRDTLKGITERGWNRVVLWAVWSICYLGMGKWKPSLSLVKRDALPRPPARRWLKFALWSFGEQLAETALLQFQSKWTERSRLHDLHNHALFI